MTDLPQVDAPVHAEVIVRGSVEPSWSDYLGGVEIAPCEVKGLAVTILRGIFPDQAALFGALNGLYALGYALLSVQVFGKAE